MVASRLRIHAVAMDKPTYTPTSPSIPRNADVSLEDTLWQPPSASNSATSTAAQQWGDTTSTGKRLLPAIVIGAAVLALIVGMNYKFKEADHDTTLAQGQAAESIINEAPPAAGIEAAPAPDTTSAPPVEAAPPDPAPVVAPQVTAPVPAPAPRPAATQRRPAPAPAPEPTPEPALSTPAPTPTPAPQPTPAPLPDTPAPTPFPSNQTPQPQPDTSPQPPLPVPDPAPVPQPEPTN
jgi:hypothetical protein